MADPLSIAGSIAGLLSVGDAVFRLVYRYARNVKNAEKEIGDLKRELEALTGTCHNVKVIATELEQDQLHSATIRLDHVNSCLNLLHKMKKNLTDLGIDDGTSKMKTSFRKLAWPYKSSETRALVGEIRCCRDTLAIALSADNMYTLLKSLSLQENIEDELAAVHRHLRERRELETRINLTEKRKTILKSFLFVDPTRNLDINKELRHPTTGFWLTEDETFQQWFNGTGLCLWLSGIPGAGKTVLSTLIIDECIKFSDSTRAAAYFYCDYKDVNSQNPVYLLGTLASQIARQNQEAFDVLEDYYQTLHPENQMETTPKAQDLLIVLKKMARAFGDVRLIVDALDECGDNTMKVTKLLQELARCETGNVSLALLSRDETDIRDIFAPPFSKHIEVAAHTEDVEQYVRTEIESRLQEKKLRIRNTDLKEEIMRRLVEKANGMFRWVTCQLDYLGGLINDKLIRAALVELPIGLEETYRRLIERIHPSAASLVRRVLFWTIHSRIRLSIKELSDATSIDIGADRLDIDCKVDGETIRSECSSLLRRVDDDRLEIAHFTVQEYLQKIDPNDPKIGKFKIIQETAYANLGKVCLTYLCMQDFNQRPPVTPEEQLHHNESYPFYNHAATQWEYYAMNSWEDKDILCLARRLFNPHKTYNFMTFCLEYISAFKRTKSRWPDLVKKITSGEFRPLHGASMIHLPVLCQYFVDEGCDVNQGSSSGTPLQFAVNGQNQFMWDDEILSYRTYRWKDMSDTIEVLVNAGATCQSYNTNIICSISLLTFLSDLERQSGVFQGLLNFGMQINSDLLSFLETAGTDLKKRCFDTLNGATINHLHTETKIRLLDIASKSGIKAPQALLVADSSNMEDLPNEQFRLSAYDAIRFDQPNELKKLMTDTRFRNDMDLLNENGSPLHCAAKSRSLQVLALLLKSEPSEELTREKTSGMTVWHLAARWGGEEALDLLISQFGDQAKGLTAESDAGTLPLVEAILGGDQVSALYLLEITKPSSCVSDELPLIYLSTAMGMTQLSDTLIEKGFNPNVTSSDGSHALFYVSPNTPLELVDTLISHGMSPEDTRADGKTPLHVVLSLDEKHIPHLPTKSSPVSDEVIKKLVSHIVIHTTDKNGNDPWHYFCTTYLRKYGLTESYDRLCRVLIDNDALLAHERVTGKSAISLLIKRWFDMLESDATPRDPVESERASQLFCHAIKQNQRPESFLQDGQSTRLLNWSIRRYGTLTDVLLEKGVNVHARCTYNDGRSALDAASSVLASEQVFQKILQHADNARLDEGNDETGKSAIHIICEFTADSYEPRKQATKLRTFLQHGADPNVTTHLGETAFILAAKAGFLEAFDVLLEYGADPNRSAGSGMGVIAAAAAGGSLRSLQKLLHLPISVHWTATFHIKTTFSMYPSFANGHSGSNILHAAAALNHSAMLRFLVAIPELSTKLNDLTKLGFTPLHFAAQVGCEDSVRFLVQNGANVNALSCIGGISPIHLAIWSRHAPVVQFLIDAGAALLSTGYGHSPEQLTLDYSYKDVARIIQTARSTTVEQIKSSSKLSEVFKDSIQQGDVEACKANIKGGALDLGFFTCGCTPLNYALCSGQSGIVVLLLDEDASTAGVACDTHFQLVLSHWHLDFNSSACIAVCNPGFNALLGSLLEKCLMYDNHWTWFTTSLVHIAVDFNDAAIDIIVSHLHDHWEWYAKFLPQEISTERSSVLNYFLEGKTVVSPEVSKYKKYSDGTTPLMLAAKLGKPGVVKKLLEHGAKPFSRDAAQLTALHLAARAGCLDSTNALLAAGAEPGALSDNLSTPLTYACMSGDAPIVSLLAKLESNRNRVDIEGWSALHHAAYAFQPAVFVSLVELGWDPYLQDLLGASPIFMGLTSKWPQSLICNYNFDLTNLRVPRATTIYCHPFEQCSKLTVIGLRMLLKRLPLSQVTHLLATEIIGEPINRTLLCHSVLLGKTEVIKVLIEAGAEIDSHDGTLGTPLIAASMAGYLEVVRLLVRCGADVFSSCYDCLPNSRFPNAVQAAVSTGRKEILQWLLAGRYTDQKAITDTAEDVERVIIPWSGICCLGVPIGFAVKRLHSTSLWEYLLYIQREKKTWQRLVPPDQIAKVPLVWEMPETIVAPCIPRCWVNTERHDTSCQCWFRSCAGDIVIRSN